MKPITLFILLDALCLVIGIVAWWRIPGPEATLLLFLLIPVGVFNRARGYLEAEKKDMEASK